MGDSKALVSREPYPSMRDNSLELHAQSSISQEGWEGEAERAGEACRQLYGGFLSSLTVNLGEVSCEYLKFQFGGTCIVSFLSLVSHLPGMFKVSPLLPLFSCGLPSAAQLKSELPQSPWLRCPSESAMLYTFVKILWFRAMQISFLIDS